MGKKFTRFMSTIMLVAALSGLSSCVNEVSQPAQKTDATETKHSDIYSSEEQIQAIVEALGADNSMIVSNNPEKNNKSIRLAHNNGKPIEVAFHPSFAGLEGYATETLDYLFGIIGEINPNYKYEIVDFEGIHEHDIILQNSNEDGGYQGTASFSSNVAEDGVSNIDWGIVTIYNDSVKSVCKSQEEYEKKIRYTITHELMHVLGFNDIYPSKTDMFVGNTFLQTAANGGNDYVATHITPNDYKNMISLYAMPSKNLSADIEKYKQMSDEYTAEYNNNCLNSEFENDKTILESLDKEEIYEFSQKSYITTTTSQELDFSIEVKDEKYYLTVTDKTGNVLEQTSGDVKFFGTTITKNGQETNVNNAVMLIENFESKYFYTNKYLPETIKDGAVTTLMLYKANGEYVLKDVFSYNAGQVEAVSELGYEMQ